MITVTPRAIEELKVLLSNRSATGTTGLRLAVVPGGCAGWQYEMKVAEAEQGDEVLEADGVRVIVAEGSVTLLEGSEIDYVDDLSDSGFRVNNPQAERSCGCGTSFESAAKPSPEPPRSEGDTCKTS